DDDHIYFEPVVSLPDNFQVKTGEEDETVIFAEKAKLYRFCQNEWKERGVGEVKLLKKCETKFRLIMRREKILKICCNHWISSQMELILMPNSNNKAFVWHADDFADGDVTHEKFCIKFKTEEVALSFKQCIE
ncbi:hypothetical protein HELRODRAFT_144824, partial [Helobdella robusta]|uniref:RanBD1 domain-containing protein n=1 Tax=Helobdella robusta TaxID=6412 RepID=T1EJG6_HELRO